VAKQYVTKQYVTKQYVTKQYVTKQYVTKIVWLDQDLWFPPAEEALDDPNGLLAAGGDLSVDRLLLAYASGIFPWYSDGQPIIWWSPDPRCIIDLNHLHTAKSMLKLRKKGRYKVTIDTQFERVIRACAQPRAYADSTWITEEMIGAYVQLHKNGHAHSFEVWDSQGDGNELVGGLYGVSIGACFFGESMFSTRPNTSKIAFITMVNQLSKWNYQLIDCQLENSHLLSLGAYTIRKTVFLSILRKGLQSPTRAGNWQADWIW
jgi:leucyl/phenylalanyl-tRNA--protein transferase